MTALTASRLAGLLGGLAGERPPRYAALARRIRLLIADGRLAVGIQLPAERELAATLRCSRATVTAAYRRLREEGWASARQGAGTWSTLPAGPAHGVWVPAPPAVGVLDLAYAAPAAPPEIAMAFTAALNDLPRLLPGHGYHPAGLPELRARIAERYTHRGLPTTAEQVLITAGALHGISVALEVLVGPGDRVIVEHPSYPQALDSIRATGARTVPVAIDATDTAAVAVDIGRAARQTSARLAYLMPDFQNPTGVLLDGEQRARLAAGLHRSGTVALIDETFAELGLDTLSGAPYAAFARADRAITAGTVSKAFWGGLRIGWLRAEASLTQRLCAAVARTHLSGPVLEQLATCHLLDAAGATLPAHRDRLRAQRDVLVAALRTALPDWRVPVPVGGLVLWCGLPGPVSYALVDAAERRGLRLAAGPRFGTGHAFADRLRLPFIHPPDTLQRAVEILTQAATTLLPHAPSGVPHRLVV
ncbi:MAG TPA: PLP-dependent aminotransferase family protein [Pseudonocardiaceae bacterium]|nr:PLP-dependent aminotransferase family protein [Pseudonocardiaceae bacterium]